MTTVVILSSMPCIVKPLYWFLELHHHYYTLHEALYYGCTFLTVFQSLQNHCELHCVGKVRFQKISEIFCWKKQQDLFGRKFHPYCKTLCGKEIFNYRFWAIWELNSTVARLLTVDRDRAAVALSALNMFEARLVLQYSKQCVIYFSAKMFCKRVIQFVRVRNGFTLHCHWCLSFTHISGPILRTTALLFFGYLFSAQQAFVCFYNTARKATKIDYQEFGHF